MRVIILFWVLVTSAVAQENTRWHDVTQWGVEGRGWGDQERFRWYDRFPEKAKETVTQSVWNLSRHSAGMMVRFKTDSSAIHAKWNLLSPNLGMPHMPPSGVSGLDLYARDADGQWRWAAATRPNKQEMQATLLKGIMPGLREYAVYLPLYNGVDSLEIGVTDDSRFTGLLPRKEKPLVFYGTSITHGACASRPGMAHPAILGRRLDRPVINIGFSGNGRMHREVGELMTEIDAAVYIIDCLPNLNAEKVTERCIPLIKLLRQARPETPILLVEDRRFTNSWLVPEKTVFHDANHHALKQAFEDLKRSGVNYLYYLEGNSLMGTDSEGSTDASHPNDLGFMRHANIFEPILRKILKAE
jgi:hypothetical protein